MGLNTDRLLNIKQKAEAKTSETMMDIAECRIRYQNMIAHFDEELKALQKDYCRAIMNIPDEVLQEMVEDLYQARMYEPILGTCFVFNLPLLMVCNRPVNIGGNMKLSPFLMQSTDQRLITQEERCLKVIDTCKITPLSLGILSKMTEQMRWEEVKDIYDEFIEKHSQIAPYRKGPTGSYVVQLEIDPIAEALIERLEEFKLRYVEISDMGASYSAEQSDIVIYIRFQNPILPKGE